MILISFILPVFNQECYLSDCLDSIFSIDLPPSSYEVICVDDCSTDKSVELIQQYQGLHENLILIKHAVNKKAGSARNTGIQAACGKYIWFVDPDDLIVSTVSHAFYFCDKNNLDVLCFNYTILKGESELVDLCFEANSPILSGTVFLEKVWGKTLIYNLGNPVRSFFRREILQKNNILFEEHVPYGEETTFMAYVISCSERVSSITDALYRYRQTDSQISSQLRKGHGDIIYFSTLGAGESILRWREDVLKISPAIASFIDEGMPWFLNRVLIRLLRTTHKQRIVFYEMLRRHHPREQLVQYMNPINRFVVYHRHLSSIMFDFAAPLYRLTKRLKR